MLAACVICLFRITDREGMYLSSKRGDRFRECRARMALRRREKAKEESAVGYHISDDDYYWLASRFCQNMMAFVFAATRFDEDKSAYFEHFFIDFLDRRGISYSVVEIDGANKRLCLIKPWEKYARE